MAHPTAAPSGRPAIARTPFDACPVVHSAASVATVGSAAAASHRRTTTAAGSRRRGPRTITSAIIAAPA